MKEPLVDLKQDPTRNIEACQIEKFEWAHREPHIFPHHPINVGKAPDPFLDNAQSFGGETSPGVIDHEPGRIVADDRFVFTLPDKLKKLVHDIGTRAFAPDNFHHLH